MVRNPKKILTGHELAKWLSKCECSLLEDKKKTQLYGDLDDDGQK